MRFFLYLHRKSFILKLTLVILLFSCMAFSQPPNFYDSWILEALVIDGTTYNMHNQDEAQTDDNGNLITLNIHESPNLSFDTYICGRKICDFAINDSWEITITSTSTANETCNNSGNQDFENLYFSFFQDSITYSYDIGCLLSGESCYLSIYKPNGDQALFWNGQLSANKINKPVFSIYPNPVKDKLSISSTFNLEQAEIQVFDIQGKLRMSRKLTNTKSIDVQNLLKGFYFLQIKDVLGNSVVKKFVK